MSSRQTVSWDLAVIGYISLIQVQEAVTQHPGRPVLGDISRSGSRVRKQICTQCKSDHIET